MKRFAISAVSLCLLSIACRADVKYTQVMKMGDGKVPVNSITTFIKDGAERTEMAMQYGPMKVNNVALTLCAEKQTIQLDPALKIYSVAPMDGDETKPDDAGDADNVDKPQGKPRTGKITSTVAVKKLDDETVGDYKCRHAMIETQTKMEGCAGNGEIKSKVEIWTADYKLPNLDCRKNFDPMKMMPRMMGGDCKIAFEQKGDVAAMGEAMRGLVVKMKFTAPDGKTAMTQEITSLSDAKLDDALFTIPADFKQVSEQEFQKQRAQAMLQAMKGGAAQDDDAANGDNGDANQNDNADHNDARGDDEPKDEAAKDAGDMADDEE